MHVIVEPPSVTTVVPEIVQFRVIETDVPEEVVVIAEESAETSVVIEEEVTSILVADGLQGPQGIPGEDGDGSATNRSYQNGDTFTMTKGTPVYLTGGTIVRAARGTLGERRVIALFNGDMALPPDGAGLFCVEGSMEATVSEWQAITGEAGGLVPGSRYFLDFEDVGKLYRSPVMPVSGTDTLYVVAVGYSISTTEMKLEVQPSVRVR